MHNIATTKGCLNFCRGTLILNISWPRSTVNLAGRRAEPQCHSHGLLNFFPTLRECEKNQGEGQVDRFSVNVEDSPCCLTGPQRVLTKIIERGHSLALN